MNRYCSLAVKALSLVLTPVSVSYADDVVILTKPDSEIQMRMPRADASRDLRVQGNSVPATPETMASAVDQRIRALFARAADPTTHHVSMESAEKAGLGYFVDHFQEMDRDGEGGLDFAEVKNFLDAQSPIARRPSTGVQIIK